MSSNSFKMYVANFCPYCQKAELVAREKKVKYDRELIDIHGTVPDWYKKLNPSETVPTLVVGGDKIILESNLVAQYLDTASTPSGAMMAGNNAVERQRIELFMSQVGFFVSAARTLLQDPLNEEKRAKLDDAVRYVESTFSAQQLSGPYLLGEKFSYGDICILPFLHQFKATLSYYTGYDVFGLAPNLKRMYAAALERESVKQTFLPAEENIAHAAYLAPESSLVKAANGAPVIFNNKYTPYGDRVKIAANIKGFKYHHVEVDLAKLPSWLKFYNCRETVPILVTTTGEPVHESMNILQFIDTVQGNVKRTLVPHTNPDEQYAVQYFVTLTDYLIGAFKDYVGSGCSENALVDVKWCGVELEKMLKKKTFGDGPFLGGKVMNAGDITLLPCLVRIKAVYPELFKYDFFSEFKLLAALLEAGVAAPETQGVFLDNATYLMALKVVFKK